MLRSSGARPGLPRRSAIVMPASTRFLPSPDRRCSVTFPCPPLYESAGTKTSVESQSPDLSSAFAGREGPTYLAQNSPVDAVAMAMQSHGLNPAEVDGTPGNPGGVELPDDHVPVAGRIYGTRGYRQRFHCCVEELVAGVLGVPTSEQETARMEIGHPPPPSLRTGFAYLLTLVGMSNLNVSRSPGWGSSPQKKVSP